MTQEEKDILLKDLCARLPYNVKLKNIEGNFDIASKTLPATILLLEELFEKHDIKPYLRPMSSMTEEEYKEWDDWHVELEEGRIKDWKYAMYIDWLNERHLDYRHLIEKGLAIEAPEGMYDIKNN